MNNTYSPLKDTLATQGQQITAMTTPAQSNNASPISLDSLKNTPTVNVPTAPIVATQPTTAPQNMADQIIQQSSVDYSPIEQQSRDLQLKIANMIPNTQGEAQALSSAKDQYGVNKFTSQLNDLNNEITMKSAELNKSDIELAQSLQSIEDKPIAMEFITGQQASVQRNANLARALKNAEIGILNARAVATQGNITLAQQMAQQAVDLQFAPQKELINTYKSQLEAIQPLLTADEKKRANEQSIRTNVALKDLETQQKNEELKQSYIIDGQAAGAPSSLVAQAAQAKTPLQAAMILGKYSTAGLKNEILKAELAKTRAEAAKINTSTSGDGVNQAGKPLKVSNAEIVNLNEAITAKNSIESLVTQYKDIINRTGTQTLYGEDAGKRESLKSSILLASKNLEKTGALDKGSTDVMAGNIPDSAFFNSEEAQTAKLDSFLKTITDKTSEYVNSYKGTSAESDPRTSRAFTTGTTKGSGGDLEEFEGTLQKVNLGISSTPSYIQGFNFTKQP